MAHIVNGSIISDSEFEHLKKRATELLNKANRPYEIGFAILLCACIIFLLCYGFMM